MNEARRYLFRGVGASVFGLGLCENKSIASEKNIDGLVDVKSFGAKGDGVTDDTKSIEAALRFLRDQGFGELHFPSGSYCGFLSIVDFGNLVISGVGRSSRIIRSRQAKAGDSIIKISAASRDIESIHIKNLVLVGGGPNGNVDAYGIEVNRDFRQSSFLCRDLLVENCVVENIASAGIVIRSAKGVSVLNNIVRNTGRDGIQLVAEDARVTGNNIANTGDDGIACHGCINDKRWLNVSYVINNNFISRVGGGGRGVALAGTSCAIVTNNHIDGYGNFGVFVLRDPFFKEGNSSPSKIIIQSNIIGCSRLETTQGGVGVFSGQEFYQSKFSYDSSARTEDPRGLYYISDIVISSNVFNASGVVDGFSSWGVSFVGASAVAGVAVTDNIFSGLHRGGVFFGSPNSLDVEAFSLTISNNTFRDLPCAVDFSFSAGCLFFNGNNLFSVKDVVLRSLNGASVLVSNNCFDSCSGVFLLKNSVVRNNFFRRTSPCGDDFSSF